MSKDTLSLGSKPAPATGMPEAMNTGRSTPNRAAARDFLTRLPTERNTTLGDGSDDWSRVPPEAVPQGCVVQWVVETVFGAKVEDHKIHRFTINGWVPYPLDLFPALMPPDYTGNVVRREGQILMIRRKELSDASRAEEKKAAADQLRNRLRELALAPLPNSSAPRTNASIKQERFTMPSVEESEGTEGGQ